MRSLPLFHRIAGQPVLVLGEGDAADAKSRLVERAGGVILTDIQRAVDEGARLAFVAHDDPAHCEADAIRLKTSGLLVNVVDRPDLCDFTTPSILDRDPVIVAIGTSGASAGLAKQLRLRLDRLLPHGLGRLALALENAREAIRARWQDGLDRRRALDGALREGGALDPFAEDSAEKLTGWLTDSGEVVAGQTVEWQLASDDPEGLTLRQARWLGEADAILFDAPEPTAILARARADAVRHVLPCDDPAPEGLTVILRRSD